MVSLAIFMISAAGIGYVLVSTNQQLTTTEYALQNQQDGMQATLAGATGSTTSVGVHVHPQQQNVSVIITTAPPAPPQSCTTSIASIVFNTILCFFGQCSGTASPSASSVVVQVPTASLSSSFAALPKNQQPPAWWQP
jgi:hypothetical protein